VDAPLVDVVNNFIYVVSGNNGTNSVLLQAASDFSSSVTAILGAGGHFNLHLPAFNNAYFSASFASVSGVQGTTALNSPTGMTSNWQIYEWGVSGVSTSPATLYGVGFDNTHVMTSGAASNFLQITGSVNTEFSPVTELMNGSTDQSFASALEPSFPNTIVYNLTDFSPGFFPNAFPLPNGSDGTGSTTAEGTGTSGIVVDNVSSALQASSIYFGVQGPSGPNVNSAVKLTQSGLN
jgi:hypothetical protein